MAKKTSNKPNDVEQVALYMDALEHPLKAEFEIMRNIIKAANNKLQERIKWNAPSYYYLQDIVTFGPPMRSLDKILLVFHHPSVVKIKSDLLEGNYSDRRLMYLSNSAEIESNKTELARILNLIIAEIDQSQA
ncbi:MAG: DUF1801 domain-containing protein [Bacteroidota bacterium]